MLELAKKVLEVVDHGLCVGVGRPLPGQMCVEAAVCYALGEPHSDRPSCVAESVRRYKIGINDAFWTSNQARAQGLRRISVAQLGSKDTVDDREFAEKIFFAVVNKVIPFALGEIAEDLRGATNIFEVESWIYKLRRFDFKMYQVLALLRAAVDGLKHTGYHKSSYDSARAARVAAEVSSDPDAVLRLAADVGVEVLQECGSPGCDFLYLV